MNESFQYAAESRRLGFSVKADPLIYSHSWEMKEKTGGAAGANHNESSATSQVMAEFPAHLERLYYDARRGNALCSE